MKKINQIQWFLLFFILLPVISFAAQVTVVKNGGFEKGSGTSAKSWNILNFGGSGPVAERRSQSEITLGAPIGSYALFVNGFNNGGTGVFQTVSDQFEAGDEIQFSARVRTDNLDGSNAFARIQLEFQDDSFTELSNTRIASDKIYVGNASGQLSKFSISGTVPEGTAHIILVLFVDAVSGSGGDAIFDDVKAVVISEDPNVPGGISFGAPQCSFPENASFEQTGIDSEEIMPNWTRFPYQSSSVSQKDNTSLLYEALDGDRAVQMNVSDGNFTGIFQIIPNVYPDAKIKFGIYARSDTLDDGAFAQLKIEYKDIEDHLLKEEYSEKMTRDNSFGSYHYFSVDSTAPENTAFAVLVIVADSGSGGSGEIVFDSACATFHNGEEPPIKIFGDVFNATNGQLIPMTEVQLLDKNGKIIKTDKSNPFEFEVSPGSVHSMVAMAEGYSYPSRLNLPIVDGDHGDLFEYYLDTQISLPMDPGFPLKLTKDVHKKQASLGDMLIYKILIENLSSMDIDEVTLIDELPNAFHLRQGSAKLNGKTIPDPIRNSPLKFELGTISANQTYEITYIAQISSKAEIGHTYRPQAVAMNSRLQWKLSNTDAVSTTIMADPTFDLATVIGKVFADQNENGIQDAGENGLADVRLATENGMIVYTDNQGRYHIPGLLPGRHVIKIDEHSLPLQTKMVTERSYIVKLTEGLIAKANFSVKLPESAILDTKYQNELKLSVTQSFDRVEPRLILKWQKIKSLENELSSYIQFMVDCNYMNLIDSWEIHILDSKGALIRTITEHEASLNDKILWDLTDQNSKQVAPGMYSAFLLVSDGVQFDKTSPIPIDLDLENTVISKKEIHSAFILEENYQPTFNILKEHRNKVIVRGTANPGDWVRVNDVEVLVDSEGNFMQELILPEGIQIVQVSKTDETGKTIHIAREIFIDENYFFMVGFAEGELGVNDVSQQIEDIAPDDHFDDGFYEEGRIAFYLKGKIKGRYLITAALDTQKQDKKRFFTNLDPDQYYPVYGDQSQLDFSANNTQSPFYILAELGENFVRWGSFQTEFDTLKLANYQRTLSGGQVYLERDKKTKYGDSVGFLKGFYAESDTEAGHDEFVGTGGSLYYLKNTQIIEGSEKIKIIMRDALNGLIQNKIDLMEGIDYEVDYNNGRILLTNPLSAFTRGKRIISSNLLNGYVSFLVVDYEYESGKDFENPTRGIRGAQYITDQLRVGGSFVHEERQGPDYKLLGADLLLKLGEKTRFVAEYAQSRSDQSKTNLSINGGLSFMEEDPVDLAVIFGGRGAVSITAEELKHIDYDSYLDLEASLNEAYRFDFQTELMNQLQFIAYYSNVDPNFSNSSVLFEEGTEKAGIKLYWAINDTTYSSISYDYQKLFEEDLLDVGLFHMEEVGGVNSLSQQVVGGNKNHTFNWQLAHEVGLWTGILEYQHQEIQDKIFQANRIDAFFRNQFLSDDIVAAQLSYEWTPQFKPYVGQQLSLNSSENYQTILGMDLTYKENTNLQLEERVGKNGNSTVLQVQKMDLNNTRYYSQFMMGHRDDLSSVNKSVFGVMGPLGEKSNYRTERQLSTYKNNWIESSLFGYEQELKPGLSLFSDYEKIDQDQGLERDAVSVGLSFVDNQKVKAFTKVEYRIDQYDSLLETEKQWLTQNLIKWQWNSDWEVLGKFNLGNTDTETISNASFMESGFGFAYRPVQYDQFQLLGRYSFLMDEQLQNETQFGDIYEESSHLSSIEGIYDINRWFQLVGKYAMKYSQIELYDGIYQVKQHLFLSRINFHVTYQWDIGLEYRMKNETEFDEKQKGFLVEIDRDISEFVRFGMGYNFTHFDDDLSFSSGDQKGFFVRLLGKF